VLGRVILHGFRSNGCATGGMTEKIGEMIAQTGKWLRRLERVFRAGCGGESATVNCQ
jgi:hypothetical protein